MCTEYKSMNAGVSPSCTCRAYFFSQDNTQRIIENLLNSDGIRLQLPSMIGGASVGNKYKVACLHEADLANSNIQDINYESVINLKKYV